MTRSVIALGLALGVLVIPANGAVGEPGQVPPMLVFERGGDLYRMTVDGSETVRLTRTQAESGPAVSPDRLYIAFSRSDEVWRVDLNGNAATKLLAARPSSIQWAGTGRPAWSPDGRSLYVGRSARSRDKSCGSIYRLGVEDHVPRRVTRGTVQLHSDPAVSPDGRRIAYISSQCLPGICCAARVVDAAGRPTSDLRKLPRGREYWQVAWSPDGRTVALEVQSGSSSAVYIAHRDGSRLRRVTPRGLYGIHPAWSPDGATIAFAGGTGSYNLDLYTIRPDGSDLRRLTRTPGQESSPAWLPRS